MAERFSSFGDFWPFYLREHAQPATRAVHVAGTWAAVAILLLGLLVGPWWLVLVALVVGYGCAWISHMADRAQPPGDLHLPDLVAARRPAAGLARRDGAARRRSCGGTACSRTRASAGRRLRVTPPTYRGHRPRDGQRDVADEPAAPAPVPLAPGRRAGRGSSLPARASRSRAATEAPRRGGPPVSVQRSRSSPDRWSNAQAIETSPSAAESAPYFIALVASSCSAMESGCTAAAVSVTSGPSKRSRACRVAMREDRQGALDHRPQVGTRPLPLGEQRLRARDGGDAALDGAREGRHRRRRGSSAPPPAPRRGRCARGGPPPAPGGRASLPRAAARSRPPA